MPHTDREEKRRYHQEYAKRGKPQRRCRVCHKQVWRYNKKQICLDCVTSGRLHPLTVAECRAANPPWWEDHLASLESRAEQKLPLFG